MNIWKRFIPSFILLGIICIIAAVCYIEDEIIQTSVPASISTTIVLDAGHGGFDGGASAEDGTVEKDINLHITQKVSAMLRLNGYDVIMSRDSDTGTEDNEQETIAKRKKSDLSNRLQLMKENRDAIFVSIHLNKFTTSAANGSQVFYSAGCEDSKVLGDCIQKSIVQLLQPENTRVNKQATSSTYLLYNATVPAVLVECGFLSNTAELKRLKDEEYQKKMAFSIFCGIVSFYSDNSI